MCSARNSSFGWGLRSSLILWTTIVSAAAMLALLVWVHVNLRYVLAARIDQFLDRKLNDFRSVVNERGFEDPYATLVAEARRETLAYRDAGLVVIVRRKDDVMLSPENMRSGQVYDRLNQLKGSSRERSIVIPPSGEDYRIAQTLLPVPNESSLQVQMAWPMADMNGTMAEFDRFVIGGGIVFLGIAVLGGRWLSRKALQPVADSIATAQRMNPEDLSARLPRTGAGDELDRLAETINQLLDRLARYHEQITRFTADASHELRAPLGAMRATIEVALQNPRSNDEYRGVLESLAEQCERLGQMVGNLLLLAKADAGQMAIHREAIELGSLIEEVVELYQPLAEEREVAVTWQARGPLPLLGDPSRLCQMLTNLVDNAVKFTPPGGHVSIAAESSAAGLELTIRDTGVGIAADHLPHVFDRFYQADDARSTLGSGLGLSICRWIVAAHEGSIQIISQAGAGTTISVRLPSTETSAAANDSIRVRLGGA